MFHDINGFCVNKMTTHLTQEPHVLTQARVAPWEKKKSLWNYVGDPGFGHFICITKFLYP